MVKHWAMNAGGMVTAGDTWKKAQMHRGTAVADTSPETAIGSSVPANESFLPVRSQTKAGSIPRMPAVRVKTGIYGPIGLIM